MFEGDELLFVWFLMFTILLIGVILGSYVRKRRWEKGKLDWKKIQVSKHNISIFIVLGAILGSIGLYCIATHVGVLELILRVKGNREFDNLVSLLVIVFGSMFLGGGVGGVLGLLIFPIKNPQQHK